MKVAQVLVGEKFVLDDRGGVWERIGDNETGVVARCFFGPREVFGKETVIDPAAYCYVIFEERKQFSQGSPAPVTAPAGCVDTTIRIYDTEEEVLLQEIVNPSQSLFDCLSSSDSIRLTPSGKRKSRVYNVSEFAFDVNENAFYMQVLNSTTGAIDEDDR